MAPMPEPLFPPPDRAEPEPTTLDRFMRAARTDPSLSAIDHPIAPTMEDSLIMDVKRLNTFVRPLRVDLIVDGQPETVNLSYLPIKIMTPIAMGRMRMAQGDRFKSIELLASVLADVLYEWDVTSDGEPYPTTHEALEVLAMDFLGALTGAIDADLPAAIEAMNVVERVLPAADPEADKAPAVVMSINGAAGNRAQRRAALQGSD